MGYKHGELHLTFEKKRNKTIASYIYYHGALKVIRPQYDEDGQIGYILVNLGGGYLQGDQYHIDLMLKNQADVRITTQAATKIYRTDRDAACQYITVHLSEQSNLEYLPDPVIPYMGSDFLQEQSINMDNSSSLFLSEIITDGYDPNHKKFAYKRLDLTTKIFFERQLKVFDRLHFSDRDRLDSDGFMSGFSHLGSAIAVYPEFCEDDLSVIRGWLPYNDEVISGITKLPVPGFVVRFLGNHTQVIEQQIYSVLDFFRKKGGKSGPIISRKY